MLEVLIALALMSVLTTMVVAGTIAHARSARANMSQLQVNESSRRFLQQLYADASDSVGPDVNEETTTTVAIGDVLTFYRTNLPTVTVVQYRYQDLDGNPVTINDNVIIRDTVDNPSSLVGSVVLRWCSRIGTTPIFAFDPNAEAPLVNVRVRTGDRTNPPSDADNALTGVGFQSFLIRTSISREEPVS